MPQVAIPIGPSIPHVESNLHIAIAFVLAMIIRHYVVEAFKIPTGSMEPTLIGDPAEGDKILVNGSALDSWTAQPLDRPIGG